MAEGVGFEPTVGTNPQRFSRPSHSAALAPFRRGTLSAFGEKVRQERRTFSSQNAVLERRVVVEARVGAHVVESGGGTGLRVSRTEDKTADAGIQQRPGTHHAGLQGDHQSAVVETPASESSRGVAQCKHLGVRSGITGLFAFVVARGNHLAVVQHNGSDGNVTMGNGCSGLRECFAHRGFVCCALLCL